MAGNERSGIVYHANFSLQLLIKLICTINGSKIYCKYKKDKPVVNNFKICCVCSFA